MMACSPTEIFVSVTLAANFLLAVLLLAYVADMYRKQRSNATENFYQHADPSTLRKCSQGQFLLEIDGFLTPEQCEMLIDVGQKKGLEKSQVGEQDSAIDTTIRKSKQTWIKPHEHPLANLVRDKVKSLVMKDKRVSACFDQIGNYYFEDIQIVKYGVKGKYDPHFDGTECGEDVGVECASNQRVATVLIYLNDTFGGGHTRFPNLDVDVKPKQGKAIFFWVSDATGESRHTYEETLHGGDPVTHGEKYICTQWIRFR